MANVYIFAQVDDVLSPEKRQTLMFDDSFERSALYFSVLQLLRIFADCIHDTRQDIEFLVSNAFQDTGSLQSVGKDGEKILSDNGKMILSRYKEVEDRMLRRITEKRDEVISLRDGVRLGTTSGDKILTCIFTAIQCNSLTRGVKVYHYESICYRVYNYDYYFLTS
jgi:hypothetical protein